MVDEFCSVATQGSGASIETGMRIGSLTSFHTGVPGGFGQHIPGGLQPSVVGY